MPHSPFRLGLDLDGVFANFNGDGTNHGMLKHLITISGRDLLPEKPYEPQEWHYFQQLGYLPSEISAAWEAIKASPLWWYELAPYPEAPAILSRLSQLGRDGLVAVTFITTRPGRSAHHQSRAWLEWYGLNAAQVCIADSSAAKGELAAGLGLDAYVDDYPPNLDAIDGAACDRYLFSRPWNRYDRHHARLTTHEQIVRLVL